MLGSGGPSPDGGNSIGACSNDTFTPSGNLTCADTFDGQVSNPPPILPQNGGGVVTGSCGGYLVWLNDGMLYSFACIYDSTTRRLVGAKEATDTGVPCSGAGTTLPLSCGDSRSYADAGAAD